MPIRQVGDAIYSVDGVPVAGRPVQEIEDQLNASTGMGKPVLLALRSMTGSMQSEWKTAVLGNEAAMEIGRPVKAEAPAQAGYVGLRVSKFRPHSIVRVICLACVSLSYGFNTECMAIARSACDGEHVCTGGRSCGSEHGQARRTGLFEPKCGARGPDSES